MKARPVACGALGNFERGRVQQMADVFGLLVAHEDGGSILLLDREPLRWGEADKWPSRH